MLRLRTIAAAGRLSRVLLGSVVRLRVGSLRRVLRGALPRGDLRRGVPPGRPPWGLPDASFLLCRGGVLCIVPQELSEIDLCLW